MSFDPKILWSLLSVFAGWLLAQFSGILRDAYSRHRVRKCLLEELGELQTELDRLSLIYARQLQMHALKSIDNTVPIPLSSHIFKNFYKDAVLSLNTQQRISFQLIHSHIEQINAGIEEAKAVAKRIQEKITAQGAASIRPAEGELWAEGVKAGFINAAAALWHIEHHLRHPRRPDLSLFSETHQDYLRYRQKVEDRIQAILEAARTLDREAFRRQYNPEDFVRSTLHT